MMSSTAAVRSPFTESQWQELEHQALIYKYMVSGVPVPPELIFSVKRSLETPLASRLFSPQHFGWGRLQAGYGRKPDPEPSRCRRTDGKKWRCSKEAFPDSKYCEKHMHRGRNRSRKPVEAEQLTSPSTNAAPSSSPTVIPTSPTTFSYSFSQFSSSPMDPENALSDLINPFLYDTSSDGKAPIHPFPSQTASSSRAHNDYRFNNGNDSDEKAFVPDNSLVDAALGPYKGYSQSQFPSVGQSPSSKPIYEVEDQCFPFGQGVKPTPTMAEKDVEILKQMHQCFGDEWSNKASIGSWRNLASSTTNG